LCNDGVRQILKKVKIVSKLLKKGQSKVLKRGTSRFDKAKEGLNAEKIGIINKFGTGFPVFM
jgi:hypothetical protein